MYGLTRGLMTLIGAAIAGGLIWFASWIGPRDSMGDYWLGMGLVAGAGLVMALSQLLGGWTKWGLPAISGSVLGLGFLPALVAGGWVLVAAQPEGSEARDRVLGWSADAGLSGIVSDLTTLAGAIAFGLGLIFGLVFDTTGPRRRADVVEDERSADGRYAHDGDTPHDRRGRERRYAADEPVAAEREQAMTDREHAESDTADMRTREPAAVGAPRDEQATPVAPQPEPEAEAEERPRRRFFSRR